MNRKDYPILEFDPARAAVIEPSREIRDIGAPEHCVLCFFAEVFEKMLSQGRLREIARHDWQDAPHIVYEFEHRGRRLALIHPGIGAPVAAATLEETIACGCRKFIACGGAGVLDRSVPVGHVIVPTVALRDEGTSYHYLPPDREVCASPTAVAAIERVLKGFDCPYVLAKTWTTDGPYRETPGKVRARREEGCLTVEMEAAAFLAVAQFRGVPFGQLLYGGDDVSGDEWDRRGWGERIDARERLFWLAVEACLEL